MLNESVTLNFENQQAIVKYILKDASGNAIQAHNLTVGVTGGYTFNVGYTIPNETKEEIYNRQASFTVTPATATSEFYVAMPKISSAGISSNPAFPISLIAETTDGYNYCYDKADVTFDSGKYYEITVKMKRYRDLSRLTQNYTALNGDELRGTLPRGKHLTIKEGASVTLNGVTISDANQSGITCLGNATITLVGDNSVASTANGFAGILAGGSETLLTIQGDGSLTATGGISAAGIGCFYGGSCGDITISGDTVTATGNDNGTSHHPIGKGSGDNDSGTVKVDGVENWAGSETTNLSFSAGGVIIDNVSCTRIA